MTSVLEVEPGVWSVLVGGVSYEVRVSGEQITVNGHMFRIPVEDPRKWKRSSGPAGAQGQAKIVAPMPGKVIRLLAAPGDEVTAGQGIVVVEAMKMQNELKAPRAGCVTAVFVKENDGVNAGAVLAVIG